MYAFFFPGQEPPEKTRSLFRCKFRTESSKMFGEFFEDAAFLLTVGSFLLTVELFYLQLTILAFLLTVGAFLLTVLAFLLTVGAFLLLFTICVPLYPPPPSQPAK